ncbi:MAG: HdeD family acid-resistance protein [Planctomycetes bacterium]|nr:HdeD family acid-resistance protein [Planctomycetota bacterium]
MNTESTTATKSPQHELQAFRDQWWCFLALGVALVIFGSIAIAYPAITSIAVTVLLGFLVLASGIAQIVSSFWAGKWSGMLLHLLIGLLYTIIGLMVVETPVKSTASLTLLIAIFLIVAGVFRIAVALAERFTNWGWVLLNGGVTLLLGMLILRQGKEFGPSLLWFIGLFVGIEMIFNGWSWIMLALGLRNAGNGK